MREELLVAQADSQPVKPLVVRAGLFRTFGSLAGFLALVLLTLGIYLIEDTFTSPLTAQPAALLAGGFVLGLDGVLFYFLIKPRRTTRPVRVRYRRRRSRSFKD
jgi:uncharacterized membrane protein